MKQPQLGTWFTIGARAYKWTEGSPKRVWKSGQWVEDLGAPTTYPIKTTWRSEPITPVQAMYIGYRVVHEGVTRIEYNGDDNEQYSYKAFNHEKSHVIWLFVTKANSSLIRVFPQDAVLIQDQAA